MSQRLLLKTRKFWHLVELLSAIEQPAKPAALHACRLIDTSGIAPPKQEEQVAMGKIQVIKEGGEE